MCWRRCLVAGFCVSWQASTVHVICFSDWSDGIQAVPNNAADAVTADVQDDVWDMIRYKLAAESSLLGYLLSDIVILMY